MGCRGAGQAAGQPAEDQPAPVDDRAVYRPKTADDLVAALGPERIIELDPAITYRLDQASRTVSDNYTWGNPLRDQHELVIRDCPSLTIRSAGPGRAHVATKHRYAYVMSFKNCDGLMLEGLRLGHDPDPGYCEGGVVHIADAGGVTIRDCVLYGCGTEGLGLTGVRGFVFEQSVIEDCNYGIMTASSCRDLRFVNAVFRRNREFYGFSFDNTVGIRFEGCVVANNEVGRVTGGQGLFFTNLNAPEAVIRFEGGRIADNKAGVLVQPAGMLELDGAEVGGNRFN